MNMLMIYLNILILMILLVLISLSIFISMKNYNDLEKMSPFECGFNLMNSPRNPFSLRFFLISIVFLIFDIEIILLIPFVMNIYISNSIIWMMFMTVFLFILMWGLMHEWFLGSLNWL